MRSQRFEVEQERKRWLQSMGPRATVASLILIGLIIGVAIALYYAWIAAPVVFTEASPARLSESYKDEYILLVSQSYVMDGNWEKTEARLAALGESDTLERVGGQLEAYLRSGQPAPIMRNLAALAARLGDESPAVVMFAPPVTEVATLDGTDPLTNGGTPGGTDSFTGTSGSSQDGSGTAGGRLTTPTASRPPTRTPLPTSTPTRKPTPTSVPVYRLLTREQVCLPESPAPRIEVITVDPSLDPLPGAEVIVRWQDGIDHFFTGFQPEKGLGFGDFFMDPDVIYSLAMAEGSPIIEGLQIADCPQGDGGYPGGWRLTFQNTDVLQETPTP